jgi:hypothetical protein
MRRLAGECMHSPVIDDGYTCAMPSSAQEPPDGAPSAGEETEVERYGPLIVRRMVKADGRALIRFDRADHDERS